MEELSNMYVDESGFLMIGENGLSTSIVNGSKFIPYNIQNGRRFDYEIVFVNDLLHELPKKKPNR